MKEKSVTSTSVSGTALSHSPAKTQSRRRFIGQVGVTGAASIAAGVIGFEPLLKTERSSVQGAQGSNQRANDCAKLRRDAAQAGLQATP